MQKKNTASVGIQDVLIGVLCAAVAAWLALEIYAYLISNYATARFWETWLETDQSLYTWAPLISFAFITGIGLGIIIGLAFPKHLAVKIAALAAIMQFVGGLFSGGIVSGLVIAIGLLTGALPSRVSRGSK